MLPASLTTFLVSLQAPPESPCLARLAAEVAGDRREALEPFWAERKAQGTPIYEPGGDPQRTLVTFVWRGDAGTRNVVVNFDAVTEIADLQLARLADTDVWYRSYHLPSEARFYYQFSPNDSLLRFEDEKDWGTREKTFTSDPLNPKVRAALQAYASLGSDEVVCRVIATAEDAQDGALVPAVRLIALDRKGQETPVALAPGDRIQLRVNQGSVKFEDATGLRLRARAHALRLEVEAQDSAGLLTLDTVRVDKAVTEFLYQLEPSISIQPYDVE